MFISNAEKTQIFLSLEVMQAQILNLETELVLARERVAKLEVISVDPQKRQGREWSQEQRKKQSDFMKQRHADEMAKRAGL
jgi:hypothetical protein